MPSRLFMRFRKGAVRDGGVDLRWFINSHLAGDLGESVPVRIYRRRFPDFSRPEDQNGFFDGVQPDAEHLLFDGSLERDGKKLEFRDESVESYETYAYWVSYPEWETPPLGPNPIRVRDPEVYWSFDRIQRRLESMASDDMVTLTEYGGSVEHRPIQAVQVGADNPCIAIIGLVHAGESGPELALPIVERLLAEHRNLLKTAGVAVLPVANPDQRQRVVEGVPWYLRRNANGVDLNRNFDAGWEEVDFRYGQYTDDPDAGTYRGPEPASEPETRAMVAFVEDVQPATVLATHYMGSICGGAMQAADPADDEPYRERCREIAEAYTAGMYGPDREIILRWVGSGGSLKTWLHDEFGLPGFALEDDDVGDSELGRQDRTTQELLDTYRDRHYGGVVSVLELLAQA